MLDIQDRPPTVDQGALRLRRLAQVMLDGLSQEGRPPAELVAETVERLRAVLAALS